MHSQEPRIIHSDLKGVRHLHFFLTLVNPISQTNILITTSLRACIADFDWSRLSEDSRLPLNMTQSGRPGGSLNFMAPELFNYDPDDSQSCRGTLACDIYAYSCVCYEVSSILLAVSLANTRTGVRGKPPFFKLQE
jgi:serine/threonine protein kinase